jgi:hypothetical protein
MDGGAQNRVKTTSRAGKNRWRTGKMICKFMKQDKNEQTYKKRPTPVVGQKPNGKSQIIIAAKDYRGLSNAK